MDDAVTITNQMGMTHNSFNFSVAVGMKSLYARVKNIPGVKKNATLENKRAGVNNDTFKRFIC